MATGAEINIFLRIIFFIAEKFSKLMNSVIGALFILLLLFVTFSWIWLNVDIDNKYCKFIGNILSVDSNVSREVENIQAILKNDINEEQLKPMLSNIKELENILKPKLRNLYLLKTLPIIYFGLLFILIAILFHTIPAFNAKMIGFLEKKIDTKSWPLSYLFKLDVVEEDKISNSKTMPSYIYNMWYLAEKNQNIMDNINKVIKLPLDRLIGCYIAEVTDLEGKEIKNVALARIRYDDDVTFNSDSSKGSLVYEGIGIDHNGSIMFWHSSPLCIDLFSLPQNESSYGKNSSSLLFKTTKGKITKFIVDKEPNVNSDMAENFGDIKIPREYFNGSPSENDQYITGWFTDIIIENGIAKTNKNKANLRPIINQIRDYKITTSNEVKVKGEMLINTAFKLTILYDKFDKILAAERIDHIKASTQLVKEIEMFVKSSVYWKEGSIFSNFLKNKENNCEH